MPLHSSSRELCSVLQCTPQSLQNDCVRMLPAVLWRYRTWIEAGTEVGMEKYAIVMTTPSRGLSWFALLKGGLCRPWEPMQKGVLGKGKVAGGPGQPFLWMQHIVDAACGACHMPHATCIISSILNSVVASGGVVGAGLSDDSKHHASLTMLSSVSMSSPLRSLCCASVGDRMSRRATRPQSR